jgi:hypothetical protein
MISLWYSYIIRKYLNYSDHRIHFGFLRVSVNLLLFSLSYKEERVIMKKKGLFCLAAMLFMIALSFFTACKCPPDPPDPAETGNLDIVLGGVSRTVLPDEVQFTRYEVNFDPKDGQSPVSSISTSDFISGVSLGVGQWKISAIGYDHDIPLARGEKIVNITREKQAITIPITLPVEGDGSFSYSVDLSGEFSFAKAELSLLKIDSESPSVTRNLLFEGFAGNFNIKAGFYQLSVSVTGGSQERTLTRFEILHIYSNKTSSYALYFTAEDFNNVYNLSGKVNLALGSREAPKVILLYAYIDEERTRCIGSGQIIDGNWSITIPDRYTPMTIYYKIELVGTWGSTLINAGSKYTPAGDQTGIDLGTISVEGMTDVAFVTVSGIEAKLSLYSEDSIYPLTQGNNESVRVILNGGDQYRWAVDGDELKEFKDKKEVVIAADSYSPGVHVLTCTVNLIGESPYDKEFWFRVMAAGNKISAVVFSALSANGSVSLATTLLTLSLDSVITGLTEEDITITGTDTGIKKGMLLGSGPSYILSVSGIHTSGEISVLISKAGYAISPAFKIVKVQAGNNVAVNISLGEDIPLFAPAETTIYKGAAPSSLTIQAPGAYDSYQWYVDGVPQGTNSASITLSSMNYTLGRHSVTVVASINGAYYSANQEVFFTVITPEQRDISTKSEGNWE